MGENIRVCPTCNENQYYVYAPRVKLLNPPYYIVYWYCPSCESKTQEEWHRFYNSDSYGYKKLSAEMGNFIGQHMLAEQLLSEGMTCTVRELVIRWLVRDGFLSMTPEHIKDMRVELLRLQDDGKWLCRFLENSMEAPLSPVNFTEIQDF